MPCVAGLVACMAWAGTASASTVSVSKASRPPATLYAAGNGAQAFTIGAMGTLGRLAQQPSSSTSRALDQIAVTPNGKYAYAIVAGDDAQPQGALLTYAIDQGTGALHQTVAPLVATGDDPRDLVVTPNGKNVYVTNGESDTVSMYAVSQSTGALTPLAGKTVAGGASPNGIVVTPNGKYGYVADGGELTGFFDDRDGQGVSVYSINAKTGALTRLASSVLGDDQALDIAVTPNGKTVYVTNRGVDVDPDSVSTYAVNAKTGALNGQGDVAAKYGPVSIAVNPNGKTAYVANDGVDKMSTYAINAKTGALSVLNSPTIMTGDGPENVVVTANGRYAYVSNAGSSTVSQYSISPTSGALSPLSPSSIAIPGVHGIAVSGS
jgi:DNA-binding beta-propeller fold protein YncE